MKKTLFIGLVLAASAQMFGASAQDLLKQTRIAELETLLSVMQ